MAFEPNNKAAHGGKRPNAGRKKKLPLDAAADYSSPEKIKEWLGAVELLATSAESEKVQLAAYQELLNRALGKPKEPKEVTMRGGIAHAGMSDEALVKLHEELGLPMPPGLARGKTEEKA